MILYTKKDYNFALKLYSEIERFFIKCWMKGHPSITKNSISDRPVEVMIQDAKGITFICSPESCEDKELIEYLKLVKKLKKGLFPLWLEKITFSPEVEALLYRKQVVDFSDQTKFKECSSSLVAGLRNLFRKIEEGNESDEEDETATNEKKQAKSQGCFTIQLKKKSVSFLIFSTKQIIYFYVMTLKIKRLQTNWTRL